MVITLNMDLDQEVHPEESDAENRTNESNSTNESDSDSTNESRDSASPHEQMIDSEEWREGVRAVRHLQRELQQPQYEHLLEQLRSIKDERDAREEKAVAQMRKELASRNLLEPALNDYYVLLRFLCANNFDQQRAVALFAEHLKWREEVHLDDAPNFDYPELASVSSQYPCFFHGVDREGHPLYFELMGRANPGELLKHTTIERYVRYRLKCASWLFGVCFPAASVACSRVIHETTNILDARGVNLRFITPDSMGFFQAISRVWGDYFPDALHHAYIINGGLIFRSVWGVLQHIIYPTVASRLDVLGGDYHDHLFKRVDPSQVPAALGGTCQCEGPGGCFASNKGPWQDPEILKVVRLMRKGSLDLPSSADVMDTTGLTDKLGRVRWQSGEFKFDGQSVPRDDSSNDREEEGEAAALVGSDTTVNTFTEANGNGSEVPVELTATSAAKTSEDSCVEGSQGDATLKTIMLITDQESASANAQTKAESSPARGLRGSEAQPSSVVHFQEAASAETLVKSEPPPPLTSAEESPLPSPSSPSSPSSSSSLTHKPKSSGALVSTRSLALLLALQRSRIAAAIASLLAILSWMLLFLSSLLVFVAALPLRVTHRVMALEAVQRGRNSSGKKGKGCDMFADAPAGSMERVNARLHAMEEKVQRLYPICVDGKGEREKAMANRLNMAEEDVMQLSQVCTSIASMS